MPRWKADMDLAVGLLIEGFTLFSLIDRLTSLLFCSFLCIFPYLMYLFGEGVIVVLQRV
jgi:hypothetical protein